MITHKDAFIVAANEKHRGKYDYSSVVYIKAKQNVVIICPVHGAFEQTPQNHLASRGCLACSPKDSGAFSAVTNTDSWTALAAPVFSGRYDYSKVVYVNAKTKVEIMCPVHGSFWQLPRRHLAGTGCKQCGYKSMATNITMDTASFVVRAKTLHGGKHDYSKVKYESTHQKVEIICPVHGSFLQSPHNHLIGDCKTCAQSVRRSKGEIEVASFVESLFKPSVSVCKS